MCTMPEEGIDIIWLGARTTANFAVQESPTASGGHTCDGEEPHQS
jgi:hypothetical protein